MVSAVPVHRGIGNRSWAWSARVPQTAAMRSVGSRVKGEDDLVGIRDRAIHDEARRHRVSNTKPSIQSAVSFQNQRRSAS